MKVVLCGPPRSGKSCLREGLKGAVRALPNAPYPYVLTACPDGEGAWFQETVERSPREAAEIKAAYKGRFTAEFVKRVADSVKNVPLPLTIVDVGGVPSAENREICRHASHAILLAGDMSRLGEWRSFCHDLGLKVVAEIHSDYHGASDVVVGSEGGVLHASVHHLERGEPVSERPAIKALAQHLVSLVEAEG